MVKAAFKPLLPFILVNLHNLLNLSIFYLIYFYSGQGETLVSILIDLNGFWTYENREQMAAETADTSGDV